MRRLLITGVTGFVGQHFCVNEEIKHNKIKILGIGREDIPLHTIQNCEYVSLDLSNLSILQDVIKQFQPDFILHLAAQSSVFKSWQEPVDSFINNTKSSLNLLEAVRYMKSEARILLVGSSEVYGHQSYEAFPLKEIQGLNPGNPYAISRVSQEMLAKLYVDTYKLNIMITRSFNHIGLGQSISFFIPSIITQLIKIKKNGGKGKIQVGNIDVIRDFLDVKDVISAYWKILQKGKAGRIYNVCSGTGFSLREIINIIANKLSISPEIEIDQARIRMNDSSIMIGDNSRIKEELGWQQQYTLFQTLDNIISFYMESEHKK